MASLLALQNPDGGWPYLAGAPSWTEPTAYALLALAAAGGRHAGMDRSMDRGAKWLRASQRWDGGWAPQPGIEQSTSVTAVVALLGPRVLGAPEFEGAMVWMMRQDGRGLLGRLERRLFGGRSGTEPMGWAWYPGTNAWVTPTALSILALRKAQAWGRSGTGERAAAASDFLCAHADRDGGWNYGAPRVLGVDARSYPETTGVALLALHGADNATVRTAVTWAQGQLNRCQSSEAESWLRLGLLAHAALARDAAPAVRPARNVQQAGLALLAEAAARGANPFLEIC
jgi:Prenyltransferase and squalene oxidase repeat